MKWIGTSWKMNNDIKQTQQYINTLVKNKKYIKKKHNHNRNGHSRAHVHMYDTHSHTYRWCLRGSKTTRSCKQYQHESMVSKTKKKTKK